MRLVCLLLFIFAPLIAWSQSGPGGISTGLRLWMDASDTSTLFKDAACSSGQEVSSQGDTVKCWVDKSSQAYKATNSGSNAPVWKKDGSMDVLEFTTDKLVIEGTPAGAVFDNGVTVDAVEIFAVSRTRQVTNGSAFGMQRPSGPRLSAHFPWSNSRVYFDHGVCCGAGRVNAPWGGDTDYLHSWNFISDDQSSPNYQAVYRDGNLLASDSTADRFVASTDDWGIGFVPVQNKYQQINFAELIVFDRKLTVGEREQVREYLQNKWFSELGGVNYGLVAWLDSTDESTLYQDSSCTSSVSANGDPVGCWEDKSPLNNHFTQSNASKRPLFTNQGINNLNSISVNSPGDPAGGFSKTTTEYLNPGTVFVVTKYPDNNNGALMLLDAPTHSLRLEQTSNTGLLGYTHYGTSDYTSTLPSPFNTNAIISFNKPSGASYITVSSGGSQENISVGNKPIPFKTLANWFEGDIGEVIVYSRSLDAGEMERVETYLAKKWGLAPGGVLDGLQSWVDSYDLSSLYQNSNCTNNVTTDGQTVGCLKDKSGNNNDFTMTGTPIYDEDGMDSLPSVYYDGSSGHNTNYSINGSYTMFTVSKLEGTQNQRVFSSRNSNFLFGYWNGVEDSLYINGTPSCHTGCSTQAATTNAHMYSLRRNSSGAYLLKDGSRQIYSAGTSSNATMQMSIANGGASPTEHSKVFVSETIIYNRALDDDEYTLVTQYLSNKWQLRGATHWTGALNTNWFDPGNWSSGVPDGTTDCFIDNQSNDPFINSSGGIATCANVTVGTGLVTMDPGSTSFWDVYGDFNNTGTLTQNNGILRFRDGGSLATDQIIIGPDPNGKISFLKTAGGSFSFSATSETFGEINIPDGSDFSFNVTNGKTMHINQDLIVAGGNFEISSGGSLSIANNKNILVRDSGLLSITGTEDPYPQNTLNKGRITSPGRWGLIATGGQVSLKGFLLDRMDVNGLRITGQADLINLDAGQWTNLERDFVTPVKALQLNTLHSLTETLAYNVGFNWGAANGAYTPPPSPLTTDNYYLVYAPDCSGASLSFEQWHGDFWTGVKDPSTGNFQDIEEKIWDQDDTGPNCQVSISVSASPVTLSSFSAHPYNKKVQLTWETTSEINHMGFNVFRSKQSDFGFQQLNSELIKNTYNSLNAQSRYIFTDHQAENNETYYYMIQDIAFNGKSELHGPVIAQPFAFLGDPPPINSGEGSGSEETPPLVEDGNSESIQMGGGLSILQENQDTMRVQINISDITITDSAQNPGDKDVSLDGYSKLIKEFSPELLERDFLIEVGAAHTGILYEEVLLSQKPLATYSISPSAKWVLDKDGIIGNADDNLLTPIWQKDSAAYASDKFYPQNFYKISPSTVNINGKFYLEIKVFPLKYLALTQNLQKADKIILDIGLGETPWQTHQPERVTGLTPSSMPGNLKIKYKTPGFYEVTYDDLLEASVEGAFSGESISSFRLYYKDKEIPMERISSNGSFQLGDKIRFHAPFEKSLYDIEDEVVLSTIDMLETDKAPKEISTVEYAFSSITDLSHLEHYHLEENNYILNDIPMGDLVDHNYWRRIFAQSGSPAGPAGTFTHNINLNNVYNTNKKSLITFNLRGRGGQVHNPEVGTKLYVNGQSINMKNYFKTSSPTDLVFEVPQSFFQSGPNEIKLEILSDRIENGKWALIDINHLTLQIWTLSTGNNGYTSLAQYDYAEDHLISNIQSTPIVYEVSGNSVARINNTSKVGSDLLIPQNIESLGRKKKRSLFIIENNTFLKPNRYMLPKSQTPHLREEDNKADFIIVGKKELLDAAQDLIAKRESEGLSVKAVPLEQLFEEFSYGKTSPHALRELVNFTHSHWLKPAPKYLLLLGDSSIDPLQELSTRPDNQKLLPLAIQKGEHSDFGNDNWYVAGYKNLPKMAVGRLPSSNPEEIKSYIDKLIEYENGSRSPTKDHSLSSIYISDKDTLGEKFYDKLNNVEKSFSALQKKSKKEVLSRSLTNNDLLFKQEIITAFEKGPLMINYMGHGAENMWVDNSIFQTQDTDQLQNDKLPIVLAYNCLNSNHYSEDSDYKSLGESLVFNPNGGAIAFWGSTAMTSPDEQTKLAQNMLQSLAEESIKSESDVRIGDLAFKAKNMLGQQASSQDTLKSWTLIGDPSMSLPESIYTGVVERDPSLPRGPASDSSSSAGCSAFAGHKQNRSNKTPWDLIFAFLLELLLISSVPKLFRTLFSVGTIKKH